MTRFLLPMVIATGVVLAGCGVGAKDGPEPGTRVVEGKDGWRLAVPSSPVTPGDEVKVWFSGSELKPGPRVDIRIEVRLPAGDVGGGEHANLGAPGWAYFPFRETAQIGTYSVAVIDPETREKFVEAEFVVGEE